MLSLIDQIIRFLILFAGKKRNRHRTAIIIVVVLIVVFLLLILSNICTFLGGRKAKKILEGKLNYSTFMFSFYTIAFVLYYQICRYNTLLETN